MKNRIMAELLSALAVASLMVGCASQQILPKVPQTLNPGAKGNTYTVRLFHTNYNNYCTAMDLKDYAEAKLLRDRMINRIREEIEANYRAYLTELFASRATINTAGDVVELGLTGAATVVGGAGAKSILAAIATGVKGSRLSYDKNFFREKTTEIIISKMEAQRKEKLNDILRKMTYGNVQQYTFEEAWVDLEELFYAGTLQAAIQGLASEAGESASTAHKAIKASAEDRIQLFRASEEEIDLVGKLTDKVGELKKGHREADAKDILRKLNIALAVGEDACERLQMEIRAAVNNRKKTPGRMGQLAAAFGIK